MNGLFSMCNYIDPKWFLIYVFQNCAALPVKTHQEKTTENAQQLRLQFPVSSGQLHRKSGTVSGISVVWIHLI